MWNDLCSDTAPDSMYRFALEALGSFRNLKAGGSQSESADGGACIILFSRFFPLALFFSLNPLVQQTVFGRNHYSKSMLVSADASRIYVQWCSTGSHT